MELKFTATVTLTEAEIRNLIDAEIRRRFKNVNVMNIAYNIDQYNTFGMGGLVVANGGIASVPTYTLRGATVTVEQTRSE